MRIPKHDPVEDPVIERILELLSQQGKTQKDLTTYLELDSGAFTRWRYKNSKSYMSYIDRIAEFFCVSPNYLLNGIDDDVNMETMTAAEVELVKNYRMLGADVKRLISDNTRMLMNTVK